MRRFTTSDGVKIAYFDEGTPDLVHWSSFMGDQGLTQVTSAPLHLDSRITSGQFSTIRGDQASRAGLFLIHRFLWPSMSGIFTSYWIT